MALHTHFTTSWLASHPRQEAPSKKTRCACRESIHGSRLSFLQFDDEDEELRARAQMRRPETSYIESEVREIAEARTRATNNRTMHQTKQGASDKSRSSRSIIINNKNRNSRSKEMAPLQLGPSNARVVTRCNNTASPFLSFFCTPMLFKALWDVPLFVAEPRFRDDGRAIQTPKRDRFRIVICEPLAGRWGTASSGRGPNWRLKQESSRGKSETSKSGA